MLGGISGPETVIPAPSAATAESAPLANSIFLSATERVVEFIVVVVPCTVRFPVITASPSTLIELLVILSENSVFSTVRSELKITAGVTVMAELSGEDI